MPFVSLFVSDRLQSKRNLDPKVILTPEYKLIISCNSDKSHKFSIFLINPFNYIINHFFLSGSSILSVSITFNDFFPSGRYYIKVIDLTKNLDSKDHSKQMDIEFYSFQFLGTYSNFNWSLTYAINCTVKQGMDIRLAVPKQYFPFFLVEYLEGRPNNTFTTDFFSNWLVFDTSSKIGINNIMFGYRSIVNCNYLIFGPSSLSKEPLSDNGDLKKYLISEQGIETSDTIIKDFASGINAKSVFGLVHQILYLISEQITFKEQVGEFGAKYAILNKQGDCTEYSALFTALCRIKNIPSRLVAGLKKIGVREQSNWIRHAWSEIFYEGLWIPVDVVEGKAKILGFHPDLIPLFKGNWMADNMNRELKISIIDDFKDQLTTNDLVDSYLSMELSYKVNKQIQNGVNDENKSVNSTNKLINLELKQELLINSEEELVLKFDEIDKNSILGVYFKVETNLVVKSPKLVHYLEQLKEKKNNEYKIKLKLPEYPGNYEIGIFICSAYGEIVTINSVDVTII